MSPETVLVLVICGFAAGTLGALAGLGGGIIITPLLALYYGLPMHQAIGTSLVCVVATSTATSALQVEKHVADIRLGMRLELATTIGATAAALVAVYLNRTTLAVLFASFLVFTACNLLRKAWSTRAEVQATEIPPYTPKRIGAGVTASFGAGILSGLLGVGGGVVKVPVMYMYMGVPLRVATATSNLMIGVTAATSAYIYYGRGQVNALYAAALVAGVFFGSMTGARVSPRVRGAHVLLLLATVMLYLAAQLFWKSATGGLR